MAAFSVRFWTQPITRHCFGSSPGTRFSTSTTAFGSWVGVGEGIWVAVGVGVWLSTVGDGDGEGVGTQAVTPQKSNPNANRTHRFRMGRIILDSC